MRAITKAQAEKRIAEIMNAAEKEIAALAERVRQERVIPLCRRRKWTFSSGMGVYSFYDDCPVDDSRVGRTIDILDIEVYGQFRLGEWVRDVDTVT